MFHTIMATRIMGRALPWLRWKRANSFTSWMAPRTIVMLDPRDRSTFRLLAVECWSRVAEISVHLSRPSYGFLMWVCLTPGKKWIFNAKIKQWSMAQRIKSNCSLPYCPILIAKVKRNFAFHLTFDLWTLTLHRKCLWSTSSYNLPPVYKV